MNPLNMEKHKWKEGKKEKKRRKIINGNEGKMEEKSIILELEGKKGRRQGRKGGRSHER